MSDSDARSGPGSGTPRWVMVVAGIAIVAVAVTGLFLWRRSSDAAEAARLAELERVRAELGAKIAALETSLAASASTASAPASAPATAATTPPAKPAPKTVVTRELCLVKKLVYVTGTDGAFDITVDYVQMLTGKAAADAAAAAGEESPPPNDYFIVNSSTKLRTFRLPKSSTVRVLEWSGATGTTLTKIPVGQFVDIMPGGMNPQDPWKDGYYWVTVKDGKTVTKIEQQYLP